MPTKIVTSPSEVARHLPPGGLRLYRSLQIAGVRDAQARRNVPWVCTDEDGTAIQTVWRDYLEYDPDLAQPVAHLDTAKWLPKYKARAVVQALEQHVGKLVKVVVVELPASGERRIVGSRFDAGARWLVRCHPKGFSLLRGAEAGEGLENFPDPAGYGTLHPQRRKAASQRIERDPRVCALTLERAGYRCERAGCRDAADFERPDVHHLEALGAGGSDHTDNTIALCPPCHARVHRGRPDVRERLQRQINQLPRLAARGDQATQGAGRP